MKPYTRSIIDLFDGKMRYLIPLYQRQYAWKVSPQLELLWEDIDRAMNRVEKGDVKDTPHFMGPIVISLMKTYGKQVQAFEVIDGQQRLTTFQILLSALREIAGLYNSDYKEEIDKYVRNTGVMESPNTEWLKLWPSASDRRTFVSIADPTADLSGVSSLDEYDDGAVKPGIAAFEFFKARILQTVQKDVSVASKKIELLFEALKTGLAVVSIELEDQDDPQTIFETLNSRGVELSASDLMRNFIFQRAKGLGQVGGDLAIDQLYTKHWLPLDRWFWREHTTRGRQTRSRLDWLLVDHLSMKRAETISVERLFEEYRRWILNETPYSSVLAELQSIGGSAAISRRLFEQKKNDVLGRFGHFARAFDVSTAMPLILYLATESKINLHLSKGIDLVESYILVRDICGLPTSNYNRFFVEIVAKLRSSGKHTVDDLLDHLSSSESDTARWPNELQWRDAWLGRDQYKSSRQPRLRYIFEALEMRKRSLLSEEIEIKSELTIEHIMPQKWRAHWPVPGLNQEIGELSQEVIGKEIEREEHINEIGNLTLLTHSLNAKISNGPYEVKMPAVRAHASLALNRELQGFDHWDETTIQQRGLSLFNVARTIWTTPPAS